MLDKYQEKFIRSLYTTELESFIAANSDDPEKVEAVELAKQLLPTAKVPGGLVEQDIKNIKASKAFYLKQQRINRKVNKAFSK